MARGVFCYACDDFYEHPEFAEKRVDGHRVCPLATCSSEFVEELNSQVPEARWNFLLDLMRRPLHPPNTLFDHGNVEPWTWLAASCAARPCTGGHTQNLPCPTTQPQTPLQSEAAPIRDAAAAGSTQRPPNAPQTQPQHGTFGRPHVQHHQFTTPGGHQLDVHIATTVLPVGMDLSRQGFEGFNTFGEGGADVPNPQAFVSNLMQVQVQLLSCVTFHPSLQDLAPS